MLLLRSTTLADIQLLVGIHPPLDILVWVLKLRASKHLHRPDIRDLVAERQTRLVMARPIQPGIIWLSAIKLFDWDLLGKFLFFILYAVLGHRYTNLFTAGIYRKVYAILMCQLAISTSFIAFFVFNDSVRMYAQRSPGLMLVSFLVTIICLFAMSCCESARRTPPTNYVFLFIFTVAESFMLGVFSSFYRSNEVWTFLLFS